MSNHYVSHRKLKKQTKKQPKLIDTENRLRVGEEVGKRSKWGEKVQTSNYEINKSRRCRVRHGDYRKWHPIVRLKVVKTVDLLSSHHMKTIFFCNYVWRRMITRLIMWTVSLCAQTESSCRSPQEKSTLAACRRKGIRASVSPLRVKSHPSVFTSFLDRHMMAAPSELRWRTGDISHHS